MAQSNTKEAADITARPVNVRILSNIEINGIKIKSGHVARLNSETAAALVADGVADNNAEGIAYALTENGDIIDTIQSAK